MKFASINDTLQLLALENRVFSIDRMSKFSIERFINKKNILIYSKCNKIIGSAILLKRKDTLCSRLYSLAVDPDHRGKGIGSSLLIDIETLANGCSEIRLEVREDNISAINFYTKHGYKKFGRRMRYYRDGMHALRMVKELYID
jgi:[ribosomal protein S18]-alanine N-acetyltransferase